MGLRVVGGCVGLRVVGAKVIAGGVIVGAGVAGAGVGVSPPTSSIKSSITCMKTFNTICNCIHLGALDVR